MVRVVLVAFLCAACTPVHIPDTPPEPELLQTRISAPGFIDFLTVDGESVWATNEGRAERWTASGKQAEVAIPAPCGTMAALSGKLWVANCKDRNLYRVDMAGATVDAIFDTGIASPDGETNVVAGGGSIWVATDANGVISRIDPSTGEEIARIAVVPGTFFLAFGFDRLWAVSSEGRLLQRIDPATNSVTGTVTLGNQPGFLAAGEGAVWVQEQMDGTVARISPARMEMMGRTRIGETLRWGDIDTGGGSVWLRTTEDQTFVRLDAATGKITGRFGDPVGSGALRYTPRGIWTTEHDIEQLSWWPIERR